MKIQQFFQSLLVRTSLENASPVLQSHESFNLGNTLEINSVLQVRSWGPEREVTCPRSYRYPTAEPSFQSWAPDLITASMWFVWKLWRASNKSRAMTESHFLKGCLLCASPRGRSHVDPLRGGGRATNPCCLRGFLPLRILLWPFSSPPFLTLSSHAHPPWVIPLRICNTLPRHPP